MLDARPAARHQRPRRSLRARPGGCDACRMRHCGILAHSTEGAALCFLEFCQEGVRRLGSHVYPDLTLDYIAFGPMMPAWEAGDHDSIRATLSVSADRLARAGAEFFICPDNTAHLALERPGPDLALPGLHIAEVVAEQAARDGRTRVGVLGTRYTMDSMLYPRALAARGIASEVPGEADRQLLNKIIFDELVKRRVRRAVPPGVRPRHRGPGGARLRRGCARVHRDPAARDACGLAAADPGLHPPAGSRRPRGGGGGPPVAGLARRPGPVTAGGPCRGGSARFTLRQFVCIRTFSAAPALPTREPP